MQSKKDEFDAMGVKVLAVSSDSMQEVLEMKEKDGLAFELLSDPGLVAISAFGLRVEDHSEAATYVIDSEGRVRWQEVGAFKTRRDRMDDIMRALNSL